MEQSAQAIKGLKSVHIVVDIAGGAFSGTAVGDSVFPDRSRISMNSPDANIDEIMIGDQAYIKLPISQSYLPVPASSAPVNVNQTLKQPRHLREKRPGRYHCGRGEGPGGGYRPRQVPVRPQQGPINSAWFAGRIYTAPGSTPQLSTGDMWIEKGTNYVRVFKTDVPVTDSAGNPQSSAVTITLSKFNEPVTPPIEKPTNSGQIPGRTTP